MRRQKDRQSTEKMNIPEPKIGDKEIAFADWKEASLTPVKSVPINSERKKESIKRV